MSTRRNDIYLSETDPSAAGSLERGIASAFQCLRQAAVEAQDGAIEARLRDLADRPYAVVVAAITPDITDTWVMAPTESGDDLVAYSHFWSGDEYWGAVARVEALGRRKIHDDVAALVGWLMKEEQGVVDTLQAMEAKAAEHAA